MADLKKKTNIKSTLQQIVEEQKAKTPSKFEYNKVIFAWESDDRPTYTFSGKQKSVFTGLIVLFGLYFFWIGQPMLTLFAAAVFFILFVFISVPPLRAKHQIEKVGIRTMDVLYVWDDLKAFWMTERDGVIMLYIDTRLNFPMRLIFMIESFEEAYQISQILVQKIEYRFLTRMQNKMDKMLEGTYVEPTVFFGDVLETEAPAKRVPTESETANNEKVSAK